MTVKCASAPFTVTSPGAINVTSSELAGQTAQLAICFATGHLPANDPAETPGARFGVGFVATTGSPFGQYGSFGQTSGSLGYAWASRAADAVSPPLNGRAEPVGSGPGTTFNFFNVLSNTVQPRGTGFTVADVSWTGAVVDGGLQATVNATDQSYRGLCALLPLFNDPLLPNASAIAIPSMTFGNFAGPAYVDCGFQPDLLLFSSSHYRIYNGSGTAFGAHFGACLRGAASPVQKCVSYVQAGGSPGAQYLSSNHFFVEQSATGVGTEVTALITKFDSQGFWFEVDSGTGLGVQMAAIALKLPASVAASLFDFATPTATGPVATTGIGFRPQFLMAFGTNLPARDTSYYGNSQACGWCAGLSDPASQWSANFRIADGANPSDTGCIVANHALQVADATTSGHIVADLVSFDADGFTLDYTAVDTSPKVGFGIAFQETPTPSPVAATVRSSTKMWGKWPPYVAPPPPTSAGVHLGPNTSVQCASLVSTDTTSFSCSFWFNNPQQQFGFYAMAFIVDPNNTYGNLARLGSLSKPTAVGLDLVLADTITFAGSATFDDPSEAPLGWHHYLFSMDSNAGTFQLLLDGLPVSITQSFSPFVPTFNALPLFVGDDGQGNGMQTDLAYMWIAPGVSLLNMSGVIPAATVSLFRTATGHPAPVSGYPAAAVLLAGDATTFATNLGTGGSFSVVGSNFTTSATSP